MLTSVKKNSTTGAQDRFATPCTMEYVRGTQPGRKVIPCCVPQCRALRG